MYFYTLHIYIYYTVFIHHTHTNLNKYTLYIYYILCIYICIMYICLFIDLFILFFFSMCIGYLYIHHAHIWISRCYIPCMRTNMYKHEHVFSEVTLLLSWESDDEGQKDMFTKSRSGVAHVARYKIKKEQLPDIYRQWRESRPSSWMWGFGIGFLLYQWVACWLESRAILGLFWR